MFEINNYASLADRLSMGKEDTFAILHAEQNPDRLIILHDNRVASVVDFAIVLERQGLIQCLDKSDFSLVLFTREIDEKAKFFIQLSPKSSDYVSSDDSDYSLNAIFIIDTKAEDDIPLVARLNFKNLANQPKRLSAVCVRMQEFVSYWYDDYIELKSVKKNTSMEVRCGAEMR